MSQRTTGARRRSASVRPQGPVRDSRRSGAMAQAETTTDRKMIQRWIEQRRGRPAKVKGTEGDGEGILRVDFAESDDKLEPIAWQEFFKTFEDRRLAFLNQDKTSDGNQSRFFKFVRRDG